MYQSTTSQESSENEEVYLLSDEEHDEEPSEELLNYIIFLGFEVTQDEDFKEIAKKALTKELPIGWKRAFLKNSNRMCYFDTVTQNFHQYTPGDEKAIKEFEALKKSKQNILVGKGKNLPPLGGGEGGGKKKKSQLNPIKEHLNNQETNNNHEKDSEMKKNVKSKVNKYEDEKEVIELNSMLSKENKIEPEENSNNNKEDTKKDCNAFNKSYSNKNKYSELNRSFSSSKEKEGKKNDSFDRKAEHTIKVESENCLDNKSPQMKNETVNKNNNYNETKHTKTKPNSPQIKVDNTVKKEGNFNKVDNTADKKRYYEEKLKELKNFEEIEKEKFEDNRKNYKEKKNTLKEQYQTKCEDELISEFYKLEKIYNCEELARRIEHDLVNETEQYRELLENKKNRELNKELQKHDTKISSLKEEIRQTLSEIILLSKEEKEKDLNNFDSNPEILETKLLLDEKFAIEIKSLEMNFEATIKQIEFEEESCFRNDISQIKQSLKQSNDSKEKSFKSFYVKILDEYKTALDTDYALQCKNVQKEFEINFEKELDAQGKDLDFQMEENSKLMNESIKEVERDYNEEICKLRHIGRLESNDRNKIINHNFEAIAQMYEMIKRGMNEKLDEMGEMLLEKLSSLSKSREEGIEEFLLQTQDKSNLETQKKKNQYELTEIEYKTKSVMLEYFLEVGGEMISLITENNFKFNSNHDEIFYDHFIKVVKTRQQKYKQKLAKWKENKLFNIIDTFKSPIRHKYTYPLQLKNSTDKVPSLKTSFDLGNSSSQFTFVKRNIDNKRYNDSYNMIDVQASQNALSLSTSKMNQLFSSVGNRENDIINSLNSITKETITKINSFIEEEKSAFQKEETDITNDKVIQENFKDALRKTNFGYRSNINESCLISSKKAKDYIDIMNEDELKIKRNSEKLERKKEMYEKIVELYSDLCMFVQENVKDPDDNTVNYVINEKLNKIVSGINEYHDIFYQKYQKKMMNSSFTENVTHMSFSKEIPTKLNKSVNLKSSVNNPNKSYLDNYYNSIQENCSNNSFNNFVQFYGRNSIQRELRNSSSTQYFNYRKNKSNLTHKSEYLNFSFT